jgi:hypothetical protein
MPFVGSYVPDIDSSGALFETITLGAHEGTCLNMVDSIMHYSEVRDNTKLLGQFSRTNGVYLEFYIYTFSAAAK